MATAGRKRALSYDAFLSHASADRGQAERVEAALGRKRVWLDRSDIRLGALLGRELLSHIRKSRTLVLLWSNTASRSPWVQSEWISAVNLGKPVIPLVLDETPLPQCLGNTLWQRVSGARDDVMVELVRTVRGRLPRGGSIGPAMRLPDARRDAEIDGLALAQEAMLDAWDAGDAAGARKEQRRLERAVEKLIAKYPLDARAAALWAYNAKNGVILDHEQEISAGIRVVDRRLDEARRRFLHALWLDPLNPEALNGLGTIAWFGHDLHTAEFYVRAALRRSPGYAAARQDLQLILRLKRSKPPDAQ